MIVRTLKLKLNRNQEVFLEQWLYRLTSVYNWGLKKIELNAKDKIYFSKMDFQNLLPEYGKKLDMPSHTIQGTLLQVYDIAGKPIKTIVDRAETQGNKEKIWDGTDNKGEKVPTGLYFLKLETGKYKLTKKITLLR